MTEIQECLIGLLQEIDNICLENNIDYYVFAGTMLGIERNEGFLPWDDDIDIIMTKKNYDKFCSIMINNPPQNRKFECIEQNKGYPLQFGKYVRTDNACITRSLAFGNSSAGAWIDVIYVAPLPTEQKKINRIKKWFSCYCELENEVYVEFKNHYKGFYWRYKLGRCLIKLFGKNRVLNHMKKWFNDFPDSKCKKFFMYHSLFTDYREFDKKFFGKPVRRKFNNIVVNASEYNREFCRLLYGDSWMIVPDYDSQEVHKIVFDREISYEKYVDDYMIFINKNEVEKNLSEVKSLQFKNFKNIRSLAEQRATIFGLLEKKSLEQNIANNQIDLESLLSQGKYEKIGELYSNYIEFQFDPEIMNWTVFVDLGDELLYPILMKFICYDGEYYKASKILQLRELTGIDRNSEKIKKVKELIEICRNISIALWDKQDYYFLEEILETQCKDVFSIFCLDIEIAKIQLSIIKSKTASELEGIRERLLTLLSKVQKRGECLKLLGDIELKLNNEMEAWIHYNEAKKVTKNGLLLLDMQKKSTDEFVYKCN